MISLSHYTKTGLYHTSHSMPCEDRTGYFESPELLCIAIADGVSTASKSAVGAQTAVDTVLRLFGKCGETIRRLSNERICELVFDEVRFALSKLSEADNTDIAEYSSTLTFAVYYKTNSSLLVYSLGDGVVVRFDTSGSVTVMCRQPAKSGTVNTTTTIDGHRTVYLSRINSADISKVMLFTDGGWNDVRTLILQGQYGNSPETDILSAIQNSDNADDSSFISADIGGIQCQTIKEN